MKGHEPSCRISVSSLAFPRGNYRDSLKILSSSGVSGVELAPTNIFPDFPNVTLSSLTEFRRTLVEANIKISGLQSLLFGHPEFQIFDTSTWPSLIEHLRRVLCFGGEISADVAVLGSPRNRVRGSLASSTARQRFMEFAYKLEPILKTNQIVLTLEPNAPQYGADFIITYDESVKLCNELDSPWIKPQVDSGSLMQAGIDPCDALNSHPPHHVHVSEPALAFPPSQLNHDSFAAQLQLTDYRGWIVLEALAPDGLLLKDFGETVSWFTTVYGRQTNEQH